MGSLPKLEDDVKFVVTGFSQFQGVTENPTEELVNDFPSFWNSNCDKGQPLLQAISELLSACIAFLGGCLFDCTTLKVTADACDKYLSKTSQRVLQELMGQTVVWVCAFTCNS